jgi:hypothetical protein
MSAVQDALAAELRALYVYGVLGSRATGAQLAAMQQAYDAHRVRRDALLGFAHARGITPPAGAVYPTPAGIDTPTGRQTAAAAVETSCLGPYAALVGASTGQLRAWSASALSDCAVRSAAFGAAKAALPGLS